MSISNQIQYLRKIISEFDQKYYNTGTSPISDPEYNNLKATLIRLEEGTDIDEDSPTQMVGAVIIEGIPHKHNQPLLSLTNTFNTTESIKKLVRMEKAVGNPLTYVLEDKADGLTCKLTYLDGKLNLMATRGDGHVGALIDISGFYIPNDIPDDNELDIIGELVMTHEVFNQLNEEAYQTATKPYISPRNAAIGILRKSPELLTFVAFSARYHDGSQFEGTEYDLLERVKSYGFNIVQCSEPLTITEVEEALDNWKHVEEYDCDGVVVKVNELTAQDELGDATTNPNWAYAHKQNSEGAPTVLRDVKWQVGVHGSITPVGIVDPVVVSKAVVSRATLHNPMFILGMSLRLGSGVRVIRSGEIIPAIVTTDPTYDDGVLKAIPIPALCPSCGSKLTPSGPELQCRNNTTCPDRVTAQLIRIGSTDGLDLNGLGKVTAAKLVQTDLVKKPSDLFTLTYDRLREAGFKSHESKQLINSLTDIRVPLHKLIYAMCIPDIGVVNSKLLAKIYQSVERLAIVTLDHLYANTPLYPDEITKLYDYFAGENIYDNWPVTVEQDSLITSDDTLPVRTWLITGSLDVSRKVVAAQLEQLGIKLTPTVTKNVDLVIAGENPTGHKILRAKALGIPVEDTAFMLAELKKLSTKEK